MADNLDGRTFQIIPFAPGNLPIGISNDTESLFQSVFAGAPLNNWTLQKAGDDSYNFSIGSYAFVGVDHHGAIVAIASRAPELALKWRIIRNPQQDSEAYIIELSSPIAPERVWTMRKMNGRVEMRVVLMSVPPTSSGRFHVNDLFLLRPID